MEIIKIIVAFVGILTCLIIGIISKSLTKDIMDPRTDEIISDKETKIAGYLGYFMCVVILCVLYIFLF